jgi:hypothetical protein
MVVLPDWPCCTVAGGHAPRVCALREESFWVCTLNGDPCVVADRAGDTRLRKYCLTPCRAHQYTRRDRSTQTFVLRTQWATLLNDPKLFDHAVAQPETASTIRDEGPLSAKNGVLATNSGLGSFGRAAM